MKKYYILLFVLLQTVIFAQGVYVPVHDPVYDFLERMQLKGNVFHSNLIYPQLRTEVAGKLYKLQLIKNELTKVEADELIWLAEEYADEIHDIIKQENGSSIKIDTVTNRWRLFHFTDDYFKLSLSPVLGYQIGSEYKNSLTKRWDGISVFASMGEHWGFSMSFQDNAENSNTR